MYDEQFCQWTTKKLEENFLNDENVIWQGFSKLIEDHFVSTVITKRIENNKIEYSLFHNSIYNNNFNTISYYNPSKYATIEIDSKSVDEENFKQNLRNQCFDEKTLTAFNGSLTSEILYNVILFDLILEHKMKSQ